MSKKNTNKYMEVCKSILISHNPGLVLVSRKDVYDAIKKEIPQLKILNNTNYQLKKVFETYMLYNQTSSTTQKEFLINQFLTYREKKAAKLQAKKDKNKAPISELDYHSKKNEFLNSEQWRSIRYKILQQQGGRCQLCGRSSKDGIKIHVDHIIPLSVDWSKRLDKENLQVLCEDCNLGKSNKEASDWRIDPIQELKDSEKYFHKYYDLINYMDVSKLEKLIADMKEHNCSSIHELDLWAETSSSIDLLQWYEAWKPEK